MLILKDWASQISFHPKEVQKQKAVILEEFHLNGQGVDTLPQQKFLTTYYTPKYANRLPIGNVYNGLQAVKNATKKSLRAFYKKYYQPRYMSVIVVGDVNQTAVENRLTRLFSLLKNNPNHTISSRALDKRKKFQSQVISFKKSTTNKVSLLNFQPLLKPASFKQQVQMKIFQNILQSSLNARISKNAPKP